MQMFVSHMKEKTTAVFTNAEPFIHSLNNSLIQFVCFYWFFFLVATDKMHE